RTGGSVCALAAARATAETSATRTTDIEGLLRGWYGIPSCVRSYGRATAFSSTLGRPNGFPRRERGWVRARGRLGRRGPDAHCPQNWIVVAWVLWDTGCLATITVLGQLLSGPHLPHRP